GFSGSDPILTADQLASLVSQGTVRFFLVNSFNVRQIPQQILNQLPAQIRNTLQRGGGGFGGPGGFGGQSALTSWVTQHCTTVPTTQWQSSSNSTSGSGFGRNAASQLYDCATTH
ncbi:MAG TPA: hypothetical protein DHW02_15735, partial [Ktedonobacter sp.]|nr:hypothetical protein [Ktedonobacter sp.]